ncbi:MAG: hypothetical protein J6P20_05050 [Oscillospiraceae bacterium]|nr:hypothetical protein [Oscillospiraceae bacterium]
MENRRNPKYCCNEAGHPNAEKEPDKLKKLEAEMDKGAADIAITIAEMFRFMTMSAVMLPNMELDAGIVRLKIDDNGIFFEVNHPLRKQRKNRKYCTPHDFREEYDGNNEDEEGFIYDGD